MIAASTTVTEQILARATDQARPLFTFYDEGTGERTELSAATLGNWAAKIGNYLVDEIGVAPGDAVRVRLPEHWQTAAVLLGAWWAGAQVVTDGDDARVAFVAHEAMDEVDADELVIVPLDPFAMGARDLPIGVNDFGESVRAHGDAFTASGAGRLALDDVSTEALLATGSTVQQGDRVLSTRAWTTVDGIVDNFVAPLLAGASLVWVRGADEARVDALATTEKATVVLRGRGVARGVSPATTRDAPAGSAWSPTSGQ